MGDLRSPSQFYYKILVDKFTNVQGRLKTGQLIVWFSIIFLTGQIAKKPDCPVKNRTPGNPTHDQSCKFGTPLLSPDSLKLDRSGSRDQNCKLGTPYYLSGR